MSAKEVSPARLVAGQSRPRWREIVRHRSVALSCAVALALTGLSYLTHAPVSIRDVSEAALSFSGMAFGVCVTAIVLTFSFTNPRLLRALAPRNDGQPLSAFSNLVFVFTWAALAQLAVVAVALGATIVGGDESFAPSPPKFTHVVLQGVCLWLGAYALLLLVGVLRTLSQVGAVLDAGLRADTAAPRPSP